MPSANTNIKDLQKSIKKLVRQKNKLNAQYAVLGASLEAELAKTYLGKCFYMDDTTVYRGEDMGIEKYMIITGFSEDSTTTLRALKANFYISKVTKKVSRCDVYMESEVYPNHEIGPQIYTYHEITPLKLFIQFSRRFLAIRSLVNGAFEAAAQLRSDSKARNKRRSVSRHS